MKRPRAEVDIEFVPWVCADCGNLQLMADLERRCGLANCSSCEGMNVFKAGPEQRLSVKVFRRAVKPFEKGNS